MSENAKNNNSDNNNPYDKLKKMTARAEIGADMLREKIKNMTMADIRKNWERSSEPMRKMMLYVTIKESEMQKMSGKLSVRPGDIISCVASQGWNESEFADVVNLDDVFCDVAKDDSDLPYG